MHNLDVRLGASVLAILWIALSPSRADADPSSAADALRQGYAYFFVMDQTIGTLEAGHTYLFRRDVTGTRDIVSAVAEYGHIEAYPSDPISDTLNLWGVPAQLGPVDAEGICLQDPETLDCIAHVRSSLFGTPADQAPPAREMDYLQAMDFYAKEFADALPAHIQNFDSEAPIPASCPTGKTVPLTHVVLQEISIELTLGANMLPFVSSPELYARWQTNMEAMVAFLEKSYASNVTWTSYSDCNGYAEGQTVGLVARSAWSFYNVSGDVGAKEYVLHLWDQGRELYDAEDYALPDGSRGDFGDWLLADPSPRGSNSFASYLSFALLPQTLGVDAVDGRFSDVGVRKIFEVQAVGDTPVACSDGHDPSQPRSTVTETYGGFLHSYDDDCNEYMGYQKGYMDTLFALDAYLGCREGDNAGGYWGYSCANIASNQLAAVAYLNDIQDPASGCDPDEPPYCIPLIAPATLRPGENNGEGYEEGAYLYWKFFAEYGSIFQDSISVKINYDGAKKRLGAIREDAQRVADAIIAKKASPLFLPEYIRAGAVHAGVDVPSGDKPMNVESGS